jgi:hypothetical protein
MPRQRKTIQTTLTSTNNDTTWKTIGRAKRTVQSTEATQDPKENKKSDIKSTPPRPLDQSTDKQDPLQIPLPASPKLLTDETSAAELAEIEFPTLPPPITKSVAKSIISLEETKNSSAEHTDADIIMIEVDDGKPFSSSQGALSSENIGKKNLEGIDEAEAETHTTTEQTITMDDMNIGFFVQTYPEIYPPDWSLSLANHYQRPSQPELDAVDSTLLPENERR